ncbi:putative sodium/metabolite cotransporter BASS2, chloroplastic [Porphyridium purpureum]|uniref:Putative sodium/metabolite cotransporter BASS2, chloroplastic n=1 Tax=Porphyridium purpureum TaxID=35688 RepID=A0A5J4YYE2_PORPP|nr:putative sodium/metabolite cotransporter BASS2, chloroplastic [Porphyridium purpureum]|eukprot:POR6216..scf209_3
MQKSWKETCHACSGFASVRVEGAAVLVPPRRSSTLVSLPSVTVTGTRRTPIERTRTGVRVTWLSAIETSGARNTHSVTTPPSATGSAKRAKVPANAATMAMVKIQTSLSFTFECRIGQADTKAQQLRPVVCQEAPRTQKDRTGHRAVALIRTRGCSIRKVSHDQAHAVLRCAATGDHERTEHPDPSHLQRNASRDLASSPSWAQRVASWITYGFPLISLACSVAALQFPSVFLGLIAPKAITVSLCVLMLSTGLTLSPRQLLDAFKRPLPLALAFIGCYGLMPLLAMALSNTLLGGAAGEMRAGLLLLGIISGGQASNLCTYIARGDTALSVAMTSLTTLTSVVMLPLLSKALMGTVVAVSAAGIAQSCLQIVLAPIFIGTLLNQLFSATVQRVEPALPVVGIVATSIIVLRAVASSQSLIASSMSSVLLPVLLLHFCGGLAGYGVAKLFKQNEATSRTLAIETAFKSPALSFVLAKAHFSEVVAVASAVSIFVLAPLVASFASVLRYMSVAERAKGAAQKDPEFPTYDVGDYSI